MLRRSGDRVDDRLSAFEDFGDEVWEIGGDVVPGDWVEAFEGFVVGRHFFGFLFLVGQHWTSELRRNCVGVGFLVENSTSPLVIDLQSARERSPAVCRWFVGDRKSRTLQCVNGWVKVCEEMYKRELVRQSWN